MYELGDVLLRDRLCVGVPDCHDARMTASGHVLLLVRRVFVELGVHEHHVERLDIDDLVAAAVLVHAPDAGIHIVGAGEESGSIVAPMHTAHIGLHFHALSVRDLLDVGHLRVFLAKLGIWLPTQVPHRGQIEVAACCQEALFGVELGTRNFQVVSFSLKDENASLGIVLEVLRLLLHNRVPHVDVLVLRMLHELGREQLLKRGRVGCEGSNLVKVLHLQLLQGLAIIKLVLKVLIHVQMGILHLKTVVLPAV